MTNKLILIGINLVLFSLFSYLVKYEKQVDNVCNEIIKDYKWDLQSNFHKLLDRSKKKKTIQDNAEKIKNYLEKLIAVKTLNEADSVSQQAKHVINKLGWDFELDYTNHRDLGLSIINQFMDKFDAADNEAYDSKFHIVFNKQIEKGDSIHFELTPVFAHSNFDSILINGTDKINQNPFIYNNAMQLIEIKRNRWHRTKKIYKRNDKDEE